MTRIALEAWLAECAVLSLEVLFGSAASSIAADGTEFWLIGVKRGSCPAISASSIMAGTLSIPEAGARTGSGPGLKFPVHRTRRDNSSVFSRSQDNRIKRATLGNDFP